MKDKICDLIDKSPFLYAVSYTAILFSILISFVYLARDKEGIERRKFEHQYYCNSVEQELDQAVLKCDKELVKSILWKHGSCFTNKDK